MRRLRPSAPLVLATLALTMSLIGGGIAFGRGAAEHRSSLAPVTWHRLDLLNGWTYGDFDTYHAAWYKDGGGIVHLRGSIMGGGEDLSAFRLPRSARPGHDLYLSVAAYDGSSGALLVLKDGNVIAFDDTSDNVNVTQFTSLDGLSFKTP